MADFIPIPNPELNLKIIEEDDWLLAVDKPAGLPCHPLNPEERDTMVQAVLARYPEQAELFPDSPREAGLIHRLDNQTSGVLLFGKNLEAKKRLMQLSQSGGIEKTYFAWVEGRLEDGGSVTRAIAHHPKNAKKMYLPKNAHETKRYRPRPAETHYEVLEHREKSTLVKVTIRKGLRHQIRIHLASLGHPIVGDTLYGAEVDGSLSPGRHLLHAARVGFFCPWRGEWREIGVEGAGDFF